MTTGVVVLLAAVGLALGVGVWRAATDGRFRAAGAPSAAAALVHATGAQLGERATLLQFSSAFCAPCRATRRILDDIAGAVPGVTHVEVDAEEHLDATRALGIVRTPTTIVLDAAGDEVTRAAGAPRKEQVLAALAGVVS